MRRRVSHAVAAAAALLAGPMLGGGAAAANETQDCATDATRVDLSFASGAAWSLCAGIEPAGLLRLEHLAYRAPGDRFRPVLRALHPAAIRVHAHRHVAPTDLTPTLRTWAAGRCPPDAQALRADAALCQSRRSSGLLFRYGDVSGGQAARHDLDLLHGSTDGTTLRVRVSFGETGTLRPSLTLRTPGSALPPGDSSLQSTWRMAFALDSPSSDRVEELDFTLIEERESRRVMSTRAVSVETRRHAVHERFRAWRVVDTTGASYFLDSQQAVGGWTGALPDDTDPVLAVSAHAVSERDAHRLPDYLDGESLSGRDPVLWYTSSALLMPAAELRATSIATNGFVLSPFDWTARSPFAPPSGS